MKMHKKVILMILDGWGKSPDPKVSAIDNANTPFIDSLYQDYPSSSLLTDGMNVGLPEGQMGNSEVGHMNLGAGRIVYQDLAKINLAIQEDTLKDEKVIKEALLFAKNNNKAVHFLGLYSNGGVHSHIDHLKGLILAAESYNLDKVYVHAFTDGRDVDPKSGKGFLEDLLAFCADKKTKLASVIGRYYAMDRDQRWDRVELAYNLMVSGEAEYQYSSATDALSAAYERDENDEFVKASAITDSKGETIKVNDGDAMIFMNFRADRARQFSRCFTQTDFSGFVRKHQPKISSFVMLTEYAADINAPCAFPTVKLDNVLGEWLEKHNKTQLRISETEKYAHVTFFFSGGKEELFKGEERILIPSPQVATYDLQPEMNSTLLTDKLVAAIKSGEHDFIVCNYPNGDMVGHTGDFDAAVKACEAVDTSIARVLTALEETGSECLITADHGNAEQMLDNVSGQAHTAHTCEPVPLIYVGRNAQAAENGALSDLAPTILSLMKLPQPQEMTGSNLMKLS